MNSHQRRVFRRALDRALPPGTRVVEHPFFLSSPQPVYVVRPRSVFERVEYTRVMVEQEVKPFGYTSCHYSRLRLAPPRRDGGATEEPRVPVAPVGA